MSLVNQPLRDTITVPWKDRFVLETRMRFLTMAWFVAVSCAASLCSVHGAEPVAGKVIRFGWDMPDPLFVSQHVRQMEATGLDGVVIDFTRRAADSAGGEKDEPMRGRWVSSSPVKIEEIQHNIDALKATRFRRFTDNFLCMYANSGAGPEQFFIWDPDKYPDLDRSKWPGDPYGPFNTFKTNMLLAARVCRDLGFAGFFIDQEAYGSWTQMRSDWPMQVFQEDLPTIQARMRRNVAEVFRDVCEVYPQNNIILIPGGYREIKEKDLYALDNAFTDGILLGLGPIARLFDGQERAYDLTLHKRFVELKQETREAGLKCSAVPGLYKERMGYSYGVWLDHRGREHGGFHSDQFLNHFTARELGDALHYALTESDGYVWLYGEKSVLWSAGNCKDQKPNVIKPYLDAIRGCKDPRPLDGGRDPRGADKEPFPKPAADYETAGDSFETAAPGLDLVLELKDDWQIWFDPEDSGLWSRFASSGDPSLDWQPIRVGEFWERQGHKYNGYASYMVRFKVPIAFKGRALHLIIGALANKCHVYFNQGWIYGNYHGKGMYPPSGPLKMKLPDTLKFGEEENLLVVYLMNPRGPGGIYKPVWIAAEKEAVK